MKSQTSPQMRQPRVNPIPDLQAINRIRALIRSKIRDLLLFDLALETGSPANQLLKLKVRDLIGLSAGDEITALGVKPGRDELITIGPRTHKTFLRYREELNPATEGFLFKSRKGNGPLSISSASRIASRWFEEAGLNGMSGLLSLRKTWEFNQERSPRKQQAMKPARNTESTYTANSIRTKTAQELVYKELEQAIIKGQLKPGEKLVTEKLARQMGTSRIPVREAMGRLEARNFIKVQPKKGVTVSELSESNLKEMLEIRLML
ncbi:MAG: GntR family transcriptional regulator, partial [Deltaproteobacteria bacterium]|nr:GntR family transcriptional regulator [Deltaproteobacteria bacterium]